MGSTSSRFALFVKPINRPPCNLSCVGPDITSLFNLLIQANQTPTHIHNRSTGSVESPTSQCSRTLVGATNLELEVSEINLGKAPYLRAAPSPNFSATCCQLEKAHQAKLPQQDDSHDSHDIRKLGPLFSQRILVGSGLAIELSVLTARDHSDGSTCTTPNAFQKTYSPALRDPGGLSCGFYR